MRIIICGAGQVGYGIAEKLTKEGHEITIVDNSSKVIDEVCNKLDVRGIYGYASHPEVLKDAGGDESDMIIAVTHSDEVNIIACQIAHFIFKIPTKIARVRASEYLDEQYHLLFSQDNFSIDMTISPEIELAKTIYKRLELQSARDVLSFADGKIYALGIECFQDCPVLNIPLRRLNELFPDLEATVVGIKRADEMLIAHGDDELEVGDTAYIVTKYDKSARLLKIFGHSEKKVSRVIIAGAGKVGLYVAQMLEDSDESYKISIIEKNRNRAQIVSGQLSKAKMLHGDALDVAILKEAQISEADLFIGLTDNDQVNVLSSVLAKRLECSNNMALVNNSIYQEFSRGLGVDVFLNPRSITISCVLQQMRRGRIVCVHEIANSQAEIYEGEVMQSSSLLGLPLSELKLSDALRIGAIYRNGEILQPTADTIIKIGDRVIVFVLANHVSEVEYLFRTSLQYIKN